MEIKIIKEKLQELKKRDKYLDVFGSQTHRYLSFPVSLTEIEKFEHKYKFELPENFRLFLIEIGYGAGPYYGIRNLKEISEYIENWFLVDYFFSPIEWIFHQIGVRNENPFNQNRKGRPEKPFLLNQIHIDKINNGLKEEDWDDFSDCGEISDLSSDGNIRICHRGCHFEIVLVTSGELCGSILSVGCDGKNSNWIPDQFKSNITQVQKMNFEVWYEDWLDFSLSKFIKK